MATAGLDVFESTAQKSNEWIDQLMGLLHTQNKHFAFQALRAVLHALRDRLVPDEAVHLGAQFPMLLRGMYYEGWKPTQTPTVERRREEFLAKIEDGIPRRPDYDSARIATAVFMLLADRISEGEIDDVIKSLPQDIKELWPERATAAP